ncbi:MAG: hypothetical protein O3A82_00130 [Verrucomicrobia bacterium]|jgi:hypothetical protein|nr:hypothetical protein [Verrucomicrobiota bacterium]MDA0722640.1 hypothetical protein [Verrucomicrobiota bacterium]MDA1045319.1 hypothetical protein [Verrucomicrobiota bacterium]
MLETRLSKILASIFLFALIMGPGPGLYLVNPSTDNPSSTTFLGMPVLFAWASFWFFVQAGVVLVAYGRLWTNGNDLDE